MHAYILSTLHFRSVSSIPFNWKLVLSTKNQHFVPISIYVERENKRRINALRRFLDIEAGHITTELFQ